MVEHEPEPPTFVAKRTIHSAAVVGGQAALVGTFVSTVQNALGSHSRGAAGIFTRTGGTIGIFAAMGAAFAGTEAAVANARQTDDAWNGAAGGCAAGFLAGVRARSLPIAVGSCVFVGAAVGAFDMAGTLSGDPDVSKEERRRRFFKHPPKPIVDTTADS